MNKQPEPSIFWYDKATRSTSCCAGLLLVVKKWVLHYFTCAAVQDATTNTF
jgi:hypothetical protein